METLVMWANLAISQQSYCCGNGLPGWYGEMLESLNQLGLVSLYFIMEVLFS